MNVKSISRTVGLILLITGAFQIFPLLIAVIDREPKNILAYVESLCLILLVPKLTVSAPSKSVQTATGVHKPNERDACSVSAMIGSQPG